MDLDLDHWNSVYPQMMKNKTLGDIAEYKDQAKIMGINPKHKND